MWIWYAMFFCLEALFLLLPVRQPSSCWEEKRGRFKHRRISYTTLSNDCAVSAKLSVWYQVANFLRTFRFSELLALVRSHVETENNYFLVWVDLAWFLWFSIPFGFEIILNKLGVHFVEGLAINFLVFVRICFACVAWGLSQKIVLIEWLCFFSWVFPVGDGVPSLARLDLHRKLEVIKNRGGRFCCNLFEKTTAVCRRLLQFNCRKHELWTKNTGLVRISTKRMAKMMSN